MTISRYVVLAAIAVAALSLPSLAGAASLSVAGPEGARVLTIRSTATTPEEFTVEQSMAGIRVQTVRGGPTTPTDPAMCIAADLSNPIDVTCSGAFAVLAVTLGDGPNTLRAPSLTAQLRYVGGADADAVFPGTGNDIITPRAGPNRIDGSDGFDRYIVGATGRTTLSLQHADDGYDQVHAGDRAGVEGRLRGKTWSLFGRGPVAWHVTNLATIEDITLGPGPDVVDLTGFPSQELVAWGLGAGDDQWYARPGRAESTVHGGAGRDALRSFLATDIMDGGPGNDVIDDFGGIGDRLVGGAGNDTFRSPDHRADRIDGGVGSDTCTDILGPNSLFVAGCGPTDHLISVEGTRLITD